MLMIGFLACTIGQAAQIFDGARLIFKTDCTVEDVDVVSEQVQTSLTIQDGELRLVLCPDIVNNASLLEDDEFKRQVACVAAIPAFLAEPYIFLINEKPVPYVPLVYVNDEEMQADLNGFTLRSEHFESQTVQCYAERGYAFFGYTVVHEIIGYNNSDGSHKPPGDYLCLMQNGTYMFWFLFKFDEPCFIPTSAVLTDIELRVLGENHCFAPFLDSSIAYSTIDIDGSDLVIDLCHIIESLDSADFPKALRCIHQNYSHEFKIEVDGHIETISNITEQLKHENMTFKVSSEAIVMDEYVEGAHMHCLSNHNAIVDDSDSARFDCKTSLNCFFQLSELQPGELIVCKFSNGTDGYYSKSAVYNFNTSVVYFSYPFVKGDRILIGHGGAQITDFWADTLGMYEQPVLDGRTLEIIFCEIDEWDPDRVEKVAACAMTLNNYTFTQLAIHYRFEYPGEREHVFQSFEERNEYVFDFEFVDLGIIQYCNTSLVEMIPILPYSVVCESVEDYWFEYSSLFLSMDGYYRSMQLCEYNTTCRYQTPPYAPIYCNYSVRGNHYLHAINRSLLEPDCVVIGNQNLTNTILYIEIQRNKCWNAVFETSIHTAFFTTERLENITTQNYNPDAELHLVVYLCDAEISNNNVYEKCIEQIQYIPSIIVQLKYTLQGEKYAIALNAIKNNLEQHSVCNSRDEELYVEFNPYYVVGYKYLSLENISCISNSRQLELQQPLNLYGENNLLFNMSGVQPFVEMRNEMFSCKVTIIGDNTNNYVYEFFSEYEHDVSKLGTIIWIFFTCVAGLLLIVLSIFCVIRIKRRNSKYQRVETNDE